MSQQDDWSWADIKGAAAHWHELCDKAATVAALARDADPTKLPVTNDYNAALTELHHALEDRALHEVDHATQRYLQAFTIGDNLMAIINSGAGENEIALLGATLMLAGTRHELGQALNRLPTFEDDPSQEHRPDT